MNYPLCLRSGLFFALVSSLISWGHAQDRVIVVSSPPGLESGLDLQAVAEAFKDAKDLASFEQMLNNPASGLNNLDLNQDGQVDFLRILEEEAEQGKVIVIQAVLGENTYSDVAYIDVQRDDKGEYRVQVRGEPELYREPVYYVPATVEVNRSPIVVNLFDPYYERYHSPYSWGYYPSWYVSFSTVRYGFYRARVQYHYPSRWFHYSPSPCVVNYRRDAHRYHKPYRPARTFRPVGPAYRSVRNEPPVRYHERPRSSARYDDHRDRGDWRDRRPGDGSIRTSRPSDPRPRIDSRNEQPPRPRPSLDSRSRDAQGRPPVELRDHPRQRSEERTTPIQRSPNLSERTERREPPRISQGSGPNPPRPSTISTPRAPRQEQVRPAPTPRHESREPRSTSQGNQSRREISREEK
jgi:hypothetical protein